MSPALRGLYAITPEHTDTDRPDTLAFIVEQAIAGGARLIQYRRKHPDPVRRRAEATALLATCRAAGVRLIVNDDPTLAAEIGADGVHIGRDDADLTSARAQLGRDAIIGVSCYADLEMAIRAEQDGASYVAFGSIYPSATKPHAVHAPLDLLAEARDRLALPLVAIGGISPQNAGPVIAAGADMVAIVSGVFAAADVTAAARAYSRLFLTGRCPQQELPNMTRSHDLFEAAQRHIPGGVNSPVRAFRSVGGDPVFCESAAGPYLFDADGKRYVDYVGSWGPMILGHAHPDVLEAVYERCHRGLSFGAPTALETEMADKVCELVPSMDLVRMVSSGTEATMSALRLARGYTGRDKVVKFEGCYHGHVDSLLVKAGSGALTLGEPSSPGVPAALAELTLTLGYNDLDQVRETFAAQGDEIACIIVEPVAGNMNCIPPLPGFLEGLREVCDQYGALLIFDEVMTGFRVGLNGAQGLYNIHPDLTALGKIIGGGMPVGAFGGRREVMERISPLGPVYQAGTLSGNPIAMAAGLCTLELISVPGFYDRIGEHTRTLVDGMLERAKAAGVPLSANRVGGMFGLFFTDAGPVSDYAQATACNQDQFRAFFHAMLERNVYLAPSAFEAGFVSAAHEAEQIQVTLDAAAESFALVAAG